MGGQACGGLRKTLLPDRMRYHRNCNDRVTPKGIHDLSGRHGLPASLYPLGKRILAFGLYPRSPKQRISAADLPAASGRAGGSVRRAECFRETALGGRNRLRGRNAIDPLRLFHSGSGKQFQRESAAASERVSDVL